MKRYTDEEIIGKKYGRLTATGLDAPVRSSSGRIYRYFLCKCECGSELSVKFEHLNSGHTTSCGCSRISHDHDSLIGNRYGKLVVTAPADSKRNTRQKVRCVICKCDCGETKTVVISLLIGGQQKSCGCDRFRAGIDNPNYKGFNDLTGAKWSSIKYSAKERGIKFNITIKEAWDLFEFQDRKCVLTGVKLTLGIGRKGTASLDRIDSNGCYEIGNVQWVHSDINIMKLDYPNSYFVHMCKLVANHMEKENG